MNNELAFYEFDDAMAVAAILLRNDYVCMFSQEEELTIINFEWSENCNRNNIIFRDAGVFYCEQDEMCRECIRGREEVCANCRSNQERVEEVLVGDCCND